MTHIQQTPFTKTIRLSLEELTPAFFSVTAFSDDHAPLSPVQWTRQLFFRYEPNFFGLNANMSDTDIRLTTSELVDLLSPLYKHPFIQLKGEDEQSERMLTSIKAIQLLWNNSALWDYAVTEEKESGDVAFSFQLPESFSEDEFVRTLTDNQDIPLEEFESLLTTAAYQRLAFAGLLPRDLPILLPFFKNGGWPLNKDRSLGNLKVAIRLSEPEESSTEWLLETVISSTKTSKLWTPAIRKRHLPVEKALPEKWLEFADEIVNQQTQMLELMDLSAYPVSPDTFIHTTIEDGDVRKLLRDEFAKLTALGFEVVLPAWLRELKQSKMRVRVSASNQSQKSVAGLDDILSFKWQLSLNGEEINAEEFRKIVEENREFVRVGDEWFRMDVNWMNEIRELMDKAEEENWTVRELLFRELPNELTAPLEEDDSETDDPLFAFEMQRSLQDYVEQLTTKKGLPPIATPVGLHAELRPYQQEGFEWLTFMRDQKFGAVLADDMGLGKTVQMISYLLYTYENLNIDEPALIICPTSVLGNWQKELDRFAPSLKVMSHYGSNRLKGDGFKTALQSDKPNVVLSTYGTISQDIEFLEHMEWGTVTLDEAQNIKNMQTLQSRAIRRLNGKHHIALTGTPIENRLSELWAIFDFIHKGYLGSFGKFQEQFIVPIEREESERHKEILRNKIRPFLMRRTKNDPDLMLNLPEKQETKEFCALTSEQAALYEGYIEDTLAQLEVMTGFEKKGRILQMLSKLKQLCNHPALYLKEPLDDAKALLNRSIKLKRIVELAADIVDNGEQCLIFTQYIGMGQLLQHCFSELYNIDIPFLTGSMPKQQRDNLVDSFQAGEFPIFLLSLKAGGTGLNLTAANHVLHADRWWNPAVENQATDRAYRIGQTQFVQVHKFITIGTIEEKIDKMIEIKSALSEELIQSSNWLTELQEDELMDLLMLDTHALK
ncbi:DEAD/DEAH box helicase [Ureibacillus sinduriensis]|uniref:Helicase n=1 Tax=Ureibacillus sinduriensis BLB-1 = JCM 15800 TaxID=1384057 RepID=A0A0A3IMD1_9BACL|nr:DEAD/DEAH box helicase [Ureibacillus sinduriensis]KGR75997.1 helicase [Ureibacillus sinduriensis BLB-1 = JCM 15800]